MVINNAIAAGLAGSVKDPTVGDGGTILYPNDRHACTVIKVGLGGARITVQEDKSLLVRGSRQSETQEYEYVENPHGALMVFYRRSNGAYVREGDRMGDGIKLIIGSRSTYFEPSI